MSRVAVVTGPTASGKTALAIGLAKRLNGEVVSADSMQVYRGMDIGSAKPTADEMDGVAHHMLDVADPCESYSVSRYEREAQQCVDDILARGRTPIICGGTWLYIDALVRGGGFVARADPATRASLESRYESEGGEALLREIALHDPDAAERLHANDKKRVVRALEVIKLTGAGISTHNMQTQSRPPRYEAYTVALNIEPRAALYERIHLRVDLMMERGLEREARALYEAGALGGTAAQAIGYKELIEYFEGRLTLGEAVELIKRKSCNYAKRQLTWLRGCAGAKVIARRECENERALWEATNFLYECGLK